MTKLDKLKRDRKKLEILEEIKNLESKVTDDNLIDRIVYTVSKVRECMTSTSVSDLELLRDDLRAFLGMKEVKAYADTSKKKKPPESKVIDIKTRKPVLKRVSVFPETITHKEIGILKKITSIKSLEELKKHLESGSEIFVARHVPEELQIKLNIELNKCLYVSNDNTFTYVLSYLSEMMYVIESHKIKVLKHSKKCEDFLFEFYEVIS